MDLAMQTIRPPIRVDAVGPTIGYAFFLCGGVVSACSRLQPLVTLSTA
jgi:hypothetical protein